MKEDDIRHKYFNYPNNFVHWKTGKIGIYKHSEETKLKLRKPKRPRRLDWKPSEKLQEAARKNGLIGAAKLRGKLKDPIWIKNASQNNPGSSKVVIIGETKYKSRIDAIKALGLSNYYHLDKLLKRNI